MVVWRGTRLDIAMNIMQISAVELSKQCGISNSLISRWRSGKRPLTKRSMASVEVAATLVRLDEQRRLDPVLAPFMDQGHSRETSMWLYLLDENLVLEKSFLKIGGYEYRAEQRVLFGKEGFNKAASEVLEELDHIPVDRDVIVCACDPGVWSSDNHFVVSILEKIRQETQKGRSLTLVEPHEAFQQRKFPVSLWGLEAMLDGNIARYSLPQGLVEESFSVVIPGCWCGRVVADPDVADGVTSFLTSDPRIVAHEEAVIERVLQRCDTQVDGEFFHETGGYNIEALEHAFIRPSGPGQMPALEEFSSISRIPFLGLLTIDELTAIHRGLADDAQVHFGESPLVLTDKQIGRGYYRIILSAEDLIAAVVGERGFMMSAHRGSWDTGVIVPPRIVCQAVERIVSALQRRTNMEVALVSGEVFSALRVEMAVWKGTASVAWLQDGSGSFCSTHQSLVGNLDGLFLKIWEELPAQWKDRDSVAAVLKELLASNCAPVKQLVALRSNNSVPGSRHWLSIAGAVVGLDGAAWGN